MRCKGCDRILTRSDVVKNPHTGLEDDLCRKCRGVVFASLVGLDLESIEDEEDLNDTADAVHQVGEEWAEPPELT